MVNFVDNDFRGEGQELQALTLSNLNPNPNFLNNVTSAPVLHAFAQTVHTLWSHLIRGTNESLVCPAGGQGPCESSLIPLNHTFVVPGGRFREQYYWDSFWIVEGLIESGLFDIVNATLQNFMDEIETFGFIPNGGRIYYLNRSQPPVFIQMLSRYVAASGDNSILARALPLAERELTWWADHRAVTVTSPFTNRTHTMYRYSVTNTAPRPESYLVDYLTANGPGINPPLNDTQKAALYAELASGAETGWDYTARWFRPTANGSNDGLRSLDVRNNVAIDLNSILYKDHILMASLYGSSNSSAASGHSAAAQALRDGIIDLMWDPSKLAFYDFNLGINARNTIFSAATFYPLWSGIIPDEVLSGQDKAFAFFSSVNLVMNRYNGTFPSTFIQSGLQWDAPNCWPPHTYIILQALRALPANITGGVLPTPTGNQSTFNLIPANQIALNESQLPGQPLRTGNNATITGAKADINRLNGTVFNGGNATSGEGWALALQREVANRYLASAFCSWRATGGSIPGIVPRLSDPELNVTGSIGNSGHMYEKFSVLETDSAGGGGEYVVQDGFGWTNGVVLWITSNYGPNLSDPQCPSLLAATTGAKSSGAASVGLPYATVVLTVVLGVLAQLL